MNTIVVLSTMRSGAMPDGEGAFIELETSEGMLELLHCADAAGWETTLDPVEQALKRFAGGNCRHELFVNSEHEWTGKPGPMTNRAYEMVKSFIARNIAAT